MLKERFTAK